MKQITLFIIILITIFLWLNFPCEQPKEYVAVDQGKLYYKPFRYVSSNVEDPATIIVLHGGPGMLDSSYLMPQLREIYEENEIIFYDQRGSGKSLDTPINEQLITTEQFIKDLDDLRKGLNINNKVVLLGHSWGGVLAMNYAITYPEYVSALILMSTAPADYKGQLAFTNEFTQKSKNIINEVSPLYNSKEIAKLNIDEINRLYRTLFSLYVYNPKDAQRITLDLNKTSATSGVKVMEEMLKTSWMQPNSNLFPDLKKLNIPTLIIHGNEDIVPVWTATKIKNAIPNAQIVYIEKCGHFPYVEQQAQVIIEIKKFIDKLQ